jgi:hypothetical protein
MTLGGGLGWSVGDESLGRLHAVEVRHADVHQDDVGSRDRERLERGAAIAGLADHLHVGLRLDEHPETRPDEGLVVDEEDPGAHAAGRTAWTSKPPSSRGPAVSRPSWTSTRSRMPTSPSPRPSPPTA